MALAPDTVSDPDTAATFVAGLRWPTGPVCPRCGSRAHAFVRTRRVWKCKRCKRQFSVKVGTIFEDSPLGLDRWLALVWLLAHSKKRISTHTLARELGVSQKTAWFMLHRIRLAMRTRPSGRKAVKRLTSFERFVEALLQATKPPAKH
jgi:transposase-like protein